VIWLRLRTWLAAVWCGVVVALGGIAAPAAFAVLERAQAGRIAGQGFRIEAQGALFVLLALFLIERRIHRHRSEAAAGAPASAMSLEMGLILAALFCTVFGYFALQPMMEAARAGQGRFGFGALHGASSLLFLIKGLVLAVLAWRSTGSRA
jgi:hypothetical protein